MSFLDQNRYENPFQAMMAEGGALVAAGADQDDLIAIAEYMSEPTESQRDSRNIQGLATDILVNPTYIRIAHEQRNQI